VISKELSSSELADKLIQLNYDLSLVADSHPKLKGLHKEDSYIKDAANMLRTIPALEAEIEVLKGKIEKLHERERNKWEQAFKDSFGYVRIKESIK